MNGSAALEPPLAGTEVAVVGLALRVPGAATPELFWQNLCAGIESVSFFSVEELRAAGIDEELFSRPDYVPARGLIPGIEQLDAGLFGFSPMEASTTDPQHRLFLECAWEALEDGGYAPGACPGRVGVFAGAGTDTYLLHHLLPHRELVRTLGDYAVILGNGRDFLPTRVSYKLGLRGPSVNVQTACSTSLVAVHLACQSLINGESDMALAGGVTVRVPSPAGYLYQEGGVGSPDGHCRAFDAAARGTTFGDGVAVVLLKRLADALADGDPVRAVIRGSAINNDGSLKAGFTAPSVEGQAEVIADALALAGVEPGTIGYVEAHGTGTPLGDPIEVAALTRAFRAGTARTGFCALGAVKTNVGHLDAAAGAAGLIKAVLALENRLLPPTVGFTSPNPLLGLEGSPFFVNAELREWRSDGAPRRAGVSSFGIGGTNAHVVLEEAPPPAPSSPGRPYHVLTVSARSEAALQTACERLSERLRQQLELPLADVAWTLQTGRRAFAHRRAVLCRTLEEGSRRLAEPVAGTAWSGLAERGARPVALLFPGQGSQYPGQGRGLYETEAAYRDRIDRSCEILVPHLGLDLRRVLFPPAGGEDEAAERLRQTALAQPALFVTEHALACLLADWGICPDALLGHSLGEYAAACLAGVFSLEDALALVAARGRLMQGLPPGAMLTVSLPEESAAPLLGPDLAVAAVNEPGRTVVSGPLDAVEELERRLAERGTASRRLVTSHAFHSPMMDPILEPFAAVVRGVRLREPRLPFMSNVTGAWITAGEATDPAYWARHLRATVRFAAGVQALAGDRVLVEVGPGRTLSRSVRQLPDVAPAIATLPQAGSAESDAEALLGALGRLWEEGAPVDWERFCAGQRRQRVHLPPYPFERQRYWIEPPQERAAAQAAPALAKRPDVAEWFYLPSWRRTLAPRPAAAPEPAGRWLLLADGRGLAAALARRLEAAGCAVTLVTREGFDPAGDGGFDRLLDGLPDVVVHLWSVDPVRARDEVQRRGFFSLLALGRALGRRDAHPVRLGVVSDALHRVAGERRTRPEHATLLGPCRVLPQEHPHVTCRNVDLDLDGDADLDRLAGLLMTELVSDLPETVVAYRAGGRWVESFTPVHLPAPGAARRGPSPGGVYLITGGLGGVGFELAAHLARTAHAGLVLAGRTAFDGLDAERSRRVRELEALGAEILYVQADVAVEEEARELVRRALARFGRLDGVVHAAGVAGGGMIQRREPGEAAAVLAPKVDGTLALEAALADVELDFFLLCSSGISLSGGFGRADYCAANAFLDAFAQDRAARGLPVTAVNWDTWDGVGMAASTPVARGLLQAGRSAADKPVGHPLLGRRRSPAPGRTLYCAELSESSTWLLAEHRILGAATLPGTAYVELARAAFADLQGTGGVEISDLFFLAPLALEPGERREVRTVLEEDEGGRTRFRVVSRAVSGAWIEHARASLRRLDEPAQEAVDLAAVSGRCRPATRQVSREELESVGAWLGPRWRNRTELRVGAGEALARLELPAEHAGDLADFGLHPALLDEATSFAGQLAADAFFLPFSYRRIAVRNSLPARFYSHARYRGAAEPGAETLAVDLVLADESGAVLASIEEFSLKRVSGGAAARRAVIPDAGAGAWWAADVDVDAARADRVFAAELGESMQPAEAVEVFDRLTFGAGTAPQVIVSTRDLGAWLDWVRSFRPVRAAGEAASAVPAMPATPAALREGRHPRPALQVPHEPPASAAEQRLAALWQEMLDLDRVGLHDNFFELGGDSLLGVQMAARAREIGLRFTPQQIFQHQTVAELAPVVTALEEGRPGGGAAPGAAPLAPIQRWFFDQPLPATGHWNQSVLVPVHGGVEPAALAAALAALLARHDALRLRFTREDGAWIQTCAPPEGEAPFVRIDLGALPAARRDEAADAAVARLQEGFDLAAGPLLRAALLAPAGADAALLALVAHHLVVDIRSWRILLAELDAACRPGSGATPEPPRTAPYGAWTAALEARAASPETAAEAAHWRRVARAPRLPVDLPDGREANAEGMARRLQVWLAAAETRALLYTVPKAYRTETAEVLLTALALACRRWTGEPALLVDLEADGRDVFPAGLDVSRTVGWFTVLYPVLLELPAQEDVAAALKAVKEQVRNVPGDGAGAIGWGLLRQHGDPAKTPADASFLYLGAAGQAVPAGSPFGEARPSRGPDHDPRGPRTYLLEVSAALEDDRLRIDWCYGGRTHRRETVEALAAGFLDELQKLIRHCEAPEAGGITPSDFTQVRLTQEDLDDLVAELGVYAGDES